DEVTAIARIDSYSLPDGEAEQWITHPAILDLATAVAVALTPDDEQSLYVPVRYGHVHSYAPLQREVSVRAHMREFDGRAHVDIAIANVDGGLALLIDDLVLQPMVSSDLTRTDERTSGSDAKPGSSLLELSDTLGIRPDEGVIVFDHALRSGQPHLLISSV